MTCHEALALLDDFVDGELDSSVAGAMRDHIEGCDSCRREYAATTRLKELLSRAPVEDPGQDYWSETTGLILARTVDTAVTPVSELSRARAGTRRGDFVRSLISLAASIAILVSAIVVGQSHHRMSIAAVGEPMLMTQSVVLQLPDDYPTLSLDSHRQNLARGMMLLGAPGHLGRIAITARMAASTDKEQ